MTWIGGGGQLQAVKDSMLASQISRRSYTTVTLISSDVPCDSSILSNISVL